jgi:hypothetical protein
MNTNYLLCEQASFLISTKDVCAKLGWEQAFGTSQAQKEIKKYTVKNNASN